MRSASAHIMGAPDEPDEDAPPDELLGSVSALQVPSDTQWLPVAQSLSIRHATHCPTPLGGAAHSGFSGVQSPGWRHAPAVSRTHLRVCVLQNSP